MIQEIAINEYILKLTGKATLPEALELGNSYKITIDGEITTATDSNNQDGTLNRIYRFEPILCEVLKDNGSTIKAKDIRKRSQQLRNGLWKKWKNENVEIDFETYYDRKMLSIIQEIIL